MNPLPPSEPAAPKPPQWKPERRLFAAIVAAAALIALIAALVSRLSPRSVKPIEMARSDLVLRNGRLYPSSGSNAFTGVMVEQFQAGLTRSRSAVLDGRLHGLSEGWHTNGQLQVLEHFTDGVSNGLRTKYYPNGQKQSEAQIVAGQLHGAYRRWHSNGQLAEQIEFRSGQPEGLSLAYFETGSLKTRIMSRNGAVLERQSWKDGEANPPPN